MSPLHYHKPGLSSTLVKRKSGIQLKAEIRSLTGTSQVSHPASRPSAPCQWKLAPRLVGGRALQCSEVSSADHLDGLGQEATRVGGSACKHHLAWESKIQVLTADIWETLAQGSLGSRVGRKAIRIADSNEDGRGPCGSR